MKFKHQGDIPFYPFTGKIEGEKIKHSGSVILALGEHTGHKHVISVPKIEDMIVHKLPTGGWILQLKKEAIINHEQHGPITIAPGIYRVGQEREVDHFQEVTRQVID